MPLNRNKLSVNNTQDESELVGKLMKICLESVVTPRNAAEIFQTLYSIMEEIVQIQRHFCFLRCLEKQSVDRLDLINRLLDTKREFIHSDLTPIDFGEGGFGMVTNKKLQECTKLLRLPRKHMMDSSTGVPRALYTFLKEDRIASCMENVALSLRLLYEVSKSNSSEFFPYICSLPCRYGTFLYMVPSDLTHLRGSQVIEQLVSNFQSICRQYAYFYSRLRYSGLPVASKFYFEDYRWAVSTVMSRNNLIPGKSARVMCLTPVWDMFNHKSVEVTTDFDPDADELIFYSMESVSAGGQVFMDYGKRTNAEFLLFSGFVPERNPHNAVSVKLGLSAADPLADKRRRLLQSVGLQSPLECQATGDMSSIVDLLAFSRVFVMTDAELDNALAPNPEVCARLRTPDVLPHLDDKAVEFLKNRFNLLCMAYGSIISGDDPRLLKLPFLQRQCERLRSSEHALLQMCIALLEQSTDVVNIGIMNIENLQL